MATNKPRLRFDRRKAVSDYKKAIKKAADELLKEAYSDIRSEMETNEGRKDLHRMRSDEEYRIKRMVVGYADAIIDSYGTGSKMDTHYNEFLSEYRSSKIFNPARRDKYIVGRPKGSYTNLWGEEVHSSGKKAGQNIEKYYKPLAPSYAFQRAELWLFKGNRINELLTRYIDEWIKGMYQYFEYR